MKDHSEKNEMKVKLSRENENLLTKAAENVDSLRHNIKMQMAQMKVINLQKKQDFIQKAHQIEKQADSEAKYSVFKKNLKNDQVEETVFKPEFQKTNANINYMIVKARDEVNSAFKTLTSNDSKYKTFHIEKMVKDEQEFLSTDDGSSEEEKKPIKEKTMVKFGSIKIKSGTEDNPRMPTKNIVFNVKSLKSLNKNMGVFSI